MRDVYVFYLAVLGVVFAGFAASLWLAFVHDRRPHSEKGDKRKPGR